MLHSRVLSLDEFIGIHSNFYISNFNIWIRIQIWFRRNSTVEFDESNSVKFETRVLIIILSKFKVKTRKTAHFEQFRPNSTVGSQIRPSNLVKFKFWLSRLLFWVEFEIRPSLLFLLSGANYTNILWVAFLYKSVFWSFYLLTVCVCNFFAKRKLVYVVKRNTLNWKLHVKMKAFRLSVQDWNLFLF